MSLVPNLDLMTDDEKLAALESIHASINQSKEIQKKKIAENVQLVLQALKRIESDMLDRVNGTVQTIENRVKSIKDGKDGINGRDGKDGKDGRPGKDGKDGRNGRDGLQGLPGADGQDGVGVSDAHIDFDGSLIITLTNGNQINVGEVVAPDLAESIKVISNGGGTSQQVLDTLASLQTQINNLIPSQTGNSGKFLTTNGSTLSWAQVAGGLNYQGTWNASTNTPTLASGTGSSGYYYIVGTAGSTNLDGITDWQIGDWLVFNGTTWQKLDQTNLVTSVAGRTGAITLTSTDVGLGNVENKSSATIRGEITSGNVTTALGYTPLNPTTSQTANTVYAAPNGTAGAPTFRAIVAADIPTLNQNTTGTAANITASSNTTLTSLANLATVGTLTSGTWNATTIATNKGGTGLTSFTANGVVYASSTSALTTGSALTFDGTNFATTGSVTSAGASNSGNLTFTGTGNRITGDFSNATVANAVAFQTSTTNGNTNVQAIPNGTGTTGQYRAYNNSDANNSAFGQFICNASEIRLSSAITGTGTYLPMTFYTGGSEALRIDTSRNVGIGTSSPAVKTNIVGSAGVTLRIEENSSGNNTRGDFSANSTNVAVGAKSNSPLLFTTNDTERMRLDSSGNLGIGTSSPSFKLDVTGGDSTTFDQVLNGGRSANYAGSLLFKNSYWSSGAYGAAAIRGLDSGSSGGILAFYTTTNGGGTTGVPTERARIDSSGNVGIGTTSPGSNLDVKGTLRLSGSTSGYVGLAPAAAAGSTTYTLPAADGTNGQALTTNGSGTLSWSTAGGGLTISDDTTTNATRYVTFTSATSGTITSENVSSTKLTYNPSTGTLSATTVTSTSDETLKTNWRDLRDDFIEALAQVKHGTYDRLDAEVTQDGVSAQSLQKVLPNSVVSGDDGILSVNYGNAALVACIKLAERLLALENRIGKE